MSSVHDLRRQRKLDTKRSMPAGRRSEEWLVPGKITATQMLVCGLCDIAVNAIARRKYMG
jgi:hypothetical protein